MLLNGGNDTLIGSDHPDLVSGGDGNDVIYGLGGEDIIIGDSGHDRLYGGAGIDNITGGTGNDYLDGGAGRDVLFGGFGDDVYIHHANGGVDIINDDKNEAEATGYGGDTDTLYLGFNLNDIQYVRPAGTYDLVLGTAADIADGVLSDGVVIQDFYKGGNNRIEYLETADGYQVDLSFIS